MRLRVLYEDDHVAVVVKPQGMTCQGKGTATAQVRRECEEAARRAVPGKMLRRSSGV